MGYRPSCSQKEGKKKHISEFSNAFSIVSYQQRLDRGTKWEIRQRISETEKDEQKEHRGRAQSTSADVHKQRQVTHLNSSCTFDVCLMLAWAWDMSLSVHNRLASQSSEVDQDVQLHCSSSSEAEPEKAVLQPESPPLTSAFSLSTSFEEDVLDLKWRQSHRALLCPPTSVLSPLLCCFGWSSFLFCFLFFSVVELWYLGAFSYIPWDSEPPFSGRDGCSGGLKSCLCACVTFFMSSAPPQPPCVSCLCRPAADNPKRLRKMPWCIQTSARALRCRFDPKPQTECKSVHQGMRKLSAFSTPSDVARAYVLYIMWLFPIHFQVLYDMHMCTSVYTQKCTHAGVYACLAYDAYL